MVAKATRVSLDWCRLRIVPPEIIERERDESAREYHFRAILFVLPLALQSLRKVSGTLSTLCFDAGSYSKNYTTT